MGVEIHNIIKMETPGFRTTKFDVSDLPIDDDFDLNPVKKKIVFSDYFEPLDADIKKEMEKSKPTWKLFIYDLGSKSKQILATSRKGFNPRWVDENTIAYDNPNGKGRLTKAIP